MAKKTDVRMGDGAPQNACCACGCPLGDAVKVMPFVVTDEGDKKEAWCPRCFVHKRVHMDQRFYARAFTAVLCRAAKCGWTGVAQATNWCPCCRSRNTIVLPAVAPAA